MIMHSVRCASTITHRDLRSIHRYGDHVYHTLKFHARGFNSLQFYITDGT